jgi:hypothetical protein
MRKSVNAATIWNHIPVEQAEHNNKASTAETKQKRIMAVKEVP